jgi:Porin subfamily
MNGLSDLTRLMLRRIALLAAVTVAAAVIAPCASAQTLTHPNAPAKTSPPPSKKPHATAHEQSCSAFGAGFVRVPGTDACMKIGGWVTMEGTSR